MQNVYGTLFNELDDFDSDEPFYPVDDYNEECKQSDSEETQ